MQVSILIENLKPVGPDSLHVGFKSAPLRLAKPGFFLLQQKCDASHSPLVVNKSMSSLKLFLQPGLLKPILPPNCLCNSSTQARHPLHVPAVALGTT